jgi:hypothetical protein
MKLQEAEIIQKRINCVELLAKRLASEDDQAEGDQAEKYGLFCQKKLSQPSDYPLACCDVASYELCPFSIS